jgi:protease-4
MLSRQPFFASLGRLYARIVVSVGALLTCVLLVAVVVGVIVLAVDSTSHDIGGTKTQYVFGKQDSSNRLLSVKISGTIIGDADEVAGLFPEEQASGFTSGYQVKQLLRDAADDETVKGVILEINSGGGTIYGARAIADGVELYRSKTHRPVYAHIQGMGASGALWAAVSADAISADHGSSIGSIGVIFGPFKYYDKVMAEGEVLTQNGIESQYISAGKSKDLGDPYRRLTDEELTALRQSVNNDYDDFVQYVSQRRGVPTDTIRNDIGALTYDTRTAKSHKLIDTIANREEAYDSLAEAAKLSRDDYQIIRADFTTPSDDAPEVSYAAKSSSVVQADVRASACVLNRVSLAYYGDTGRLCE